MDYGIRIENHLELIRFNENHPIYISRRSLKHFVESRKKEMIGAHAKEEILNKLFFAIDNVIYASVKPDNVKINSLGRLIYTKYFESVKKVNFRIVFDCVNERLEICSMHFQKHK